MKLKDLRESIEQFDERMSIRSQIDMGKLAEAVKAFGLKYFEGLGFTVTVMERNVSRSYSSNIEIKFYVDIGELNAGCFVSMITASKNESGDIMRTDVVFNSFNEGVGTASEIQDDFEAKGNEMIRKLYRKLSK